MNDLDLARAPVARLLLARKAVKAFQRLGCTLCVFQAGAGAQRAAATLESRHGFAREQQPCDGCAREVEVIHPVSAAAR